MLFLYTSIETIIWFLPFILLTWCITWIYKSHPCLPGINPTWSWYNILLMHWIWFANILRFFFCVHQGQGLYFSCSVLVWFCYLGNAGLQFEKNSNSSLNVLFIYIYMEYYYFINVLLLLDFDSRLGSGSISRLSKNLPTFSSGTCKVTFFYVHISGSLGINLDVQYTW